MRTKKLCAHFEKLCEFLKTIFKECLYDYNSNALQCLENTEGIYNNNFTTHT